MPRIDNSLIQKFSICSKFGFTLISKRAYVLQKEYGGYIQEFYNKIIYEKRDNHSIFLELYLDPISYESIPNRVYIKSSNDDALIDNLGLNFFEQDNNKWMYYPSLDIESIIAEADDSFANKPRELNDGIIRQIFSSLTTSDKG